MHGDECEIRDPVRAAGQERRLIQGQFDITGVPDPVDGCGGEAEPETGESRRTRRDQQ